MKQDSARQDPARQDRVGGRSEDQAPRSGDEGKVAGAAQRSGRDEAGRDPGEGVKGEATPTGEPTQGETAAAVHAVDFAPAETSPPEPEFMPVVSEAAAPDAAAPDAASPEATPPEAVTSNAVTLEAIEPNAVASSPDDADPVAVVGRSDQNPVDPDAAVPVLSKSGETRTPPPASEATSPPAGPNPAASEVAGGPAPEGEPEGVPVPGPAATGAFAPRGPVRAAAAEVGPPQGLPAHANAGANGKSPFSLSASSLGETAAEGSGDVPASQDAPEAQADPKPAGALDNPGLRRALAQLGAAASGQTGAAVSVQLEAAASGQPGTAASGPPAAVVPGTPMQAAPAQRGAAAPGALAQGIVGELAQASPVASQQGLSQALASLAESGGKAAPAASPAPVPSAPVIPNVPLGAVPIEIGLKALAGVNHFQIRLDPAELGRIDVNLEIDTDGTVKARLTVDRVETLSLLQRDSRTLERAFEQAGLKPSDSGVDLSLRDQGRNDRGGSSENGRDNGRRHDLPADANARGLGEVKAAEPSAVQRTIWRGTAGIDVRI